MRVAIDVTSLAAPMSGVAQTVLDLVPRVQRTPGVDVVGLALTASGRDTIYQRFPGPLRLSRPVSSRLLQEAWQRADVPPVELLTGSVDLVHGTNFLVPPSRGAVELMTIHDLSPWRSPEGVGPSGLRFPRFVSRALARGAHVHALSEHVRADIVATLGVDPARVHVVANGIAPPSGGDAARCQALLGNSEPFLLAVGTLEPRKNFPRLVRAFATMADQAHGVDLVIAGAHGIDTDAIREAIDACGLSGRVHLPGYLTSQQKADLFAGAHGVVCPSLSEGFGIVPLEAMSLGLPVVAAKAGALPEVCGGAALMVDPLDVDAMGEAMLAIVADDVVRARLQAAGRLQAARFSWDESARSMVSLYRSLIAG